VDQCGKAVDKVERPRPMRRAQTTNYSGSARGERRSSRTEGERKERTPEEEEARRVRREERRRARKLEEQEDRGTEERRRERAKREARDQERPESSRRRDGHSPVPAVKIRNAVVGFIKGITAF